MTTILPKGAKRSIFHLLPETKETPQTLCFLNKLSTTKSLCSFVVIESSLEIQIPRLLRCNDHTRQFQLVSDQ